MSEPHAKYDAIHILGKVLTLYVRTVNETGATTKDTIRQTLHELRAEFLKAGPSDTESNLFNTYIRLICSAAALENHIDLLVPAPNLDDALNKAQTTQNVSWCGQYDRLPETSGKRKLEGGLRLTQGVSAGPPTEPLVSVITAVYDNPDTLQRCIDSVRAQTYPNVEHIIIDGGSPNTTLDVIRKNADHLTYFVSEPDKGIYSAMNKGIRVAKGTYVCLLNSDDFYDPDFVQKSVAVAKDADTAPGIVYSNFREDDRIMQAQDIDDGIYLGNLNITHCTFLAHKTCYDRIGPYREDLKILSDMVWIREGYRRGLKFTRAEITAFNFTTGGMSSGSTPERRETIIGENATCYRLVFPFLSQDEAKALYLMRFKRDTVGLAAELADKYSHSTLFAAALKSYLKHCFQDRPAFRLGREDTDDLFVKFVTLAQRFGLPRSTVHLETAQGDFAQIVARIENMPRKTESQAGKRILHYATVFSSPSETFIHDLVQRLDLKTDHENFFLCQERQLADKRPVERCFELSWPEFRPVVRDALFTAMIECWQIDVLIAHFAINEHRLHERIRHLNLRIPTLVMTHGIDVFALQSKPEYRTHVVEHLAARPDVHFTAVSDYLANALEAAGVPRRKIAVVPNAIGRGFFEHRKTSGFYDRSRTFEILSVGRLIPLKGHRFLIEALARFRETCTQDVRLTIVYGNGDDCLNDLQDLAKSLSIEDHISFVPFVNFSEAPDFFARFDLFMHPSTYSDDVFNRSESFGLSVLEAIAAGLPVITTDAGGLPEVIGDAGPFAKGVPHGNATALFEAMRDMYDSDRAFSDNRAYAQDRLERFSPDRQIQSISQLIHRLGEAPVKAAIFSSSTVQGAGYAAYRLFRGLQHTTVKPQMFTTVRNHEAVNGVTVLRHPSGNGAGWRALQSPPKSGLTIFTINHPHLSSEHLLELTAPFDIINLHWHARFLSVENIATLTRSNKPVVMTIRDMMPITGGCHFFHGCDQWQEDCQTCPQLDPEFADYPAAVLAAKRRSYDFSNLTLVAISNHSRRILEKAPYFRDCRIEVIPNSIETDVFRPHEKTDVRRQFGLPQDRKIIGYVPSFSSDVKGYNEILAALARLDTSGMDKPPFVMLVGNPTPATNKIGLEKKELGYIADNARLAQAYSAADVIVVPSLEETFSNTTAEAISCGIPVVGFKTGAIPDLVLDGITGFTYAIGDVNGLADGIRRVLLGPDMSANCRAHAEATLSFMMQADRYEALFRELVSQTSYRNAKHIQSEPINSFDRPGFLLARMAGQKLLEHRK